MTFHPRDYPPDWADIRARIRRRSGNRCEWCGAANYAPHPITRSRVILTVAHLDQDRSHNDDANLAHLCQRCHFGWDRPFNVKRAVVTRRRKRDARRGQLALIPYA